MTRNGRETLSEPFVTTEGRVDENTTSRPRTGRNDSNKSQKTKAKDKAAVATEEYYDDSEPPAEESVWMAIDRLHTKKAKGWLIDSGAKHTLNQINWEDLTPRKVVEQLRTVDKGIRTDAASAARSGRGGRPGPRGCGSDTKLNFNRTLPSQPVLDRARHMGVAHC